MGATVKGGVSGPSPGGDRSSKTTGKPQAADPDTGSAAFFFARTTHRNTTLRSNERNKGDCDAGALAISEEDLTLPCRTDPELFFAEAPADVELAKACAWSARSARSASFGALERKEPWGVWGGELFVRGVIVPRKRRAAARASTRGRTK